MFRSSLTPETGLLLVESHESRLETAIHMLFVFMDLAVIWINSDKVVVDTILARAWRPAYTPRQPARYILEIHPNRLSEFKIGDHRRVPRCLKKSLVCILSVDFYFHGCSRSCPDPHSSGWSDIYRPAR